MSGRTSRVWFNDGHGRFEYSGQPLVAARITPWGSNGDDVALGDLDGDGDLDALVTNNYGSNQVWLNDGSGRFEVLGEQLETSSSIAAALGDVDSDGDVDAFIANSTAPNRVWFNNSHPS